MSQASSAPHTKYLDMNVTHVRAMNMEITQIVLNWAATIVHQTQFSLVNENYKIFHLLLQQQRHQHRRNQINALPVRDGNRIVIGASAHQLAFLHAH